MSGGGMGGGYGGLSGGGKGGFGGMGMRGMPYDRLSGMQSKIYPVPKGGFDMGNDIALRKPFYGDRFGGMGRGGATPGGYLNNGFNNPALMKGGNFQGVPFQGGYLNNPPQIEDRNSDFNAPPPPQMSSPMQPPNLQNFGQFGSGFMNSLQQFRNQLQKTGQPNPGFAPPQADTNATAGAEEAQGAPAPNPGNDPRYPLPQMPRPQSAQQAYDNELAMYNSPQYAAYYNSLAPSTRAYMNAPGNQDTGNYLAGQARDSYNAFRRDPWSR